MNYNSPGRLGGSCQKSSDKSKWSCRRLRKWVQGSCWARAPPAATTRPGCGTPGDHDHHHYHWSSLSSITIIFTLRLRISTSGIQIFWTRLMSTGTRSSPSAPKMTSSIRSLSSTQRTRKKPLRVMLKSWSFTFGMSLISIPESKGTRYRYVDIAIYWIYSAQTCLDITGWCDNNKCFHTEVAWF